MHDELIGYLLGALDEGEQSLVEEYLATHPDSCPDLEILRRGLEPLEADGEHLDPPAGLALRTCQIVRLCVESVQVNPPALAVQSAKHQGRPRASQQR